MLGAWNIPNEMFGRIILIAFTAVIFAGEYQWGTWKNLLPRRRRVPLIVNKFVTLGAFVVVAFGAASLIAGLGMFLPVKIAGGQYGPPLAAALQSDFVRNFAVQAATPFTATISPHAAVLRRPGSQCSRFDLAHHDRDRPMILELFSMVFSPCSALCSPPGDRGPVTT